MGAVSLLLLVLSIPGPLASLDFGVSGRPRDLFGLSSLDTGLGSDQCLLSPTTAPHAGSSLPCPSEKEAAGTKEGGPG